MCARTTLEFVPTRAFAFRVASPQGAITACVCQLRIPYGGRNCLFLTNATCTFNAGMTSFTLQGDGYLADDPDIGEATLTCSGNFTLSGSLR